MKVSEEIRNISWYCTLCICVCSHFNTVYTRASQSIGRDPIWAAKCNIGVAKQIGLRNQLTIFVNLTRKVKVGVQWLYIYCMICVKIIECMYIPLVVLDNFCKLNCFLLIFFALLFALRGGFTRLLYASLRGLCAFV